MESQERKFRMILRNTLTHTVAYTSNIEVLCNRLYSEMVISFYEMEILDGKSTTLDKLSQLFQVLSRKSYTVFPVLLKALEDSGNEDVAEILRKEHDKDTTIDIISQAPASHALNANTSIWFEVGEPKSVFVGRKDEMAKLKLQWEKLLNENAGTFAIIVVSAKILGLGKSELCRQFVKSVHSENGGNSIWIQCESTEAFISSLQRYAQLRKITIESANPNNLATLFLKDLSTLPNPTVVVFDNSEKATGFLISNLKQFNTIASLGKVCFIFTVTNTFQAIDDTPFEFNYEHYFMQLDVPNETECIELFKKQSELQDTQVTKDICRGVGCLPLGISIASAYIKQGLRSDPQKRVQVKDYVKRFITMKDINHLSKIMSEDFSLWGEWKMLSKELGLGINILGVERRYRNDKSASVLFNEILMTWISTCGRQATFCTLSTSLIKIGFKHIFVKLLQDAILIEEPGPKMNWKVQMSMEEDNTSFEAKIHKLLNHLKLLDGSSEPDKLAVANTCEIIASMYKNEGFYKEEKKYIKRALSIKESALSFAHPEVLKLLDLLGNVLQRLGAQLNQRALEARQANTSGTFTDLPDNAELTYDRDRKISAFSEMKFRGSGGSGVVLKAIKPNGDNRALKFIPLDKSKVEGTQDLRREIENLLGVKHPNIITLYDFWYDRRAPSAVTDLPDKWPREDCPCAVLELEYCTSSLREWLYATYSEKKSKNVAFIICKQISSAVNYLHTRRIMHRDIKPTNILLLSDEITAGTVKLADFGTARLFEMSECDLTKHKGTPSYMPQEQRTKTYDLTIDIFSMGKVFVEILCAADKVDLLFACKEKELLQLVRRSYPPDVTSFLDSMLHDEANKRPNAGLVLTTIENWLTKYHFVDLGLNLEL